jgi:hypothetical protein
MNTFSLLIPANLISARLLIESSIQRSPRVMDRRNY